MALCFPWWHKVYERWRTATVPSGCATVAGRVQCAPESMRAHAEAVLRNLGVWTASKPLSLAAYTLGRYVTSEVGVKATAEEKVAVMEAAWNRGGRTDQGVVQLLLYRTPGSAGYGAYGPIHAAGMTAPFGRWAATSQDPSIEALLLADLVLTGRTADFSRGTDDQAGPSVEYPPGDPRAERYPVGWFYRSLPGRASKGNYWVGPLPGVDHWKTFLVQRRPDVAPTSQLGRALLAQGQAALSQRPSPWTARALYRPDWSRVPMCARPLVAGGPPKLEAKQASLAPIFAGVAVLLALGAGTSALVSYAARRPTP